MALLEIVSFEGVAMEHSFSRGNVGVLVDSVASRLNEFAMPAGAGAGAIFPSEGDVDAGTSYGPTGADFTGNLQQPVEADVKVGVQYGAAGVEFTGEYEPPAGGGEHSVVF